MTPRGITLVEVLVLVALLGIIAALFLPAVGSTPPLTDKELQLDEWRPGPEHSVVPPESIRVLDADLRGEWTDRIGWTDFSITKLENGRYGVSFLSHGRCGLGRSIKLERVATCDDGVLVLDRPVRELSGETYQRLYSVRVNHTLCLLPSVRVAETRDDASEVPYRGVLTRVR